MLVSVVKWKHDVVDDGYSRNDRWSDWNDRNGIAWTNRNGHGDAHAYDRGDGGDGVCDDRDLVSCNESLW